MSVIVKIEEKSNLENKTPVTGKRPLDPQSCLAPTKGIKRIKLTRATPAPAKESHPSDSQSCQAPNKGIIRIKLTHNASKHTKGSYPSDPQSCQAPNKAIKRIKLIRTPTTTDEESHRSDPESRPASNKGTTTLKLTRTPATSAEESHPSDPQSYPAPNKRIIRIKLTRTTPTSGEDSNPHEVNPAWQLTKPALRLHDKQLQQRDVEKTPEPAQEPQATTPPPLRQSKRIAAAKAAYSKPKPARIRINLAKKLKEAKDLERFASEGGPDMSDVVGFTRHAWDIPVSLPSYDSVTSRGTHSATTDGPYDLDFLHHLHHNGIIQT